MTTIGDLLKKDYTYVFTFGKHKGESITEVLEEDPGYILWAADNIDGFNPTSEVLDEAFYASKDNQDRTRDLTEYYPKY